MYAKNVSFREEVAKDILEEVMDILIGFIEFSEIAYFLSKELSSLSSKSPECSGFSSTLMLWL